jgi:MtaA/CmuA family methyltransferase
MKLNPKEVLEKISKNEKIDFFPELIPINPPTVEIMKMKNIYWPEAHKNSHLMAELASACNEILEFNVVNVPFDMIVEAEALGCEIVWKEEIYATPQARPSKDENSIMNISNDVLKKGRIPVILEAIELLKEKYKNDIPVIPFIQGPFTVGCNVIGVNNMFMYTIKDPLKTKQIIDKLVDLFILYSKKQFEAGAASIIILDPSVMGLTSNQYKNFVLPAYNRINKEVGNNFILHICGNVSKILDIIPDSGFLGFSFDQSGIDVIKVVEKAGSRMKIIGSVPTITYLLEGSEADVINISTEFIKSGVDILAPSCFTPPNSPIANLKAMIKAIRNWNKTL